METLIDSHCHLDDERFNPVREHVLARAQAVGVKKQIIPGVSSKGWSRIQALCQHYAGLYPSYGFHPLYLPDEYHSQLALLETWVAEAQPVAIGECGLDYYFKDFDAKQQAQFFTAQLHLARDAHLPVIIHARRAVDEVIHSVRQVPGSRGVMHSFAGSVQQAQRLLDLGFYFSFGGPITYPRAQKLRRVVQYLPLETLLLETDAPDQPLVNHRGERNEPAYLAEILHTLAELRQQEPAEIARVTTRNTLTLFAI